MISTSNLPPSVRWILRYGSAVLAVIAAYELRVAMSAWAGPGFRVYLTFTPAIMVVALMAGCGPGLLATGFSVAMVAYWILPPAGFAVGEPVERLSLLFFASTGVFMSIFAKYYGRYRRKALIYDREADLRASQARLAAFAEATFEGIIESEAGRIVDCNEQYARMTGYTVAELRGMEIASLIPLPDRGRVMAIIQAGSSTVNEATTRCKDGTVINVETHGRQLPGSKRRHTAIRDITARKQAEATLGDYNAKLETKNNQLRDATAAALNMMEDTAAARRSVELANAALTASEQRVQQALRVSHSFTFEWQPSADQVLRSGNYATLLGLTDTEIGDTTGPSYFGRVHPDDRARFMRVLGDLTPGAAAYTTEYRVMGGAGRVVVLEEVGEATFNAAGKLQRLVGVATDITARKRAEYELRLLNIELAKKNAEVRGAHAALQTSEQLMQQALQVSHSFTFEWQAAGDRLVYSASRAALLNCTGDKTRYDTGEEFTQRIHPDDRARYIQLFEKLTPAANTYTTEIRFVRSDGSVLMLSETAEASFDAAGQLDRLVGIVTDITVRRQAEDMLRASEEKFRALFEQSLDAVFLTVPDGIIVAANPAACQMFGMTEAELCRTGRNGIVDRTDHRLAAALAERKRTGQITTELTFIRKNGERFPVEISSVIMPGDPPRSFVIMRDITARKRAEVAVQQERANLLTMFDAVNVGMLLLDKTGTIKRANSMIANLAGTDRASLTGSQAGIGLGCAHISAEGLPCGRTSHCPACQVRQTFTAALESGRSSHAVETLMTLLIDGQRVPRWLEVSADPLVVDGSRHVILTLNDITGRKLTEEQLRELTQRLTYHVDHSPLAVIEWGPDMQLTRWAGAAEQIFGWPATEVLGKRMGDFRWFHADDQPQVATVSGELVSGTNPHRFSANRNYRKDGSVIFCEWYNSSLLDEDGDLRSILSLVLDVTDRNRAEEQVKASLAEKEVLLKEIHHRVKNNLQVIASLISLQTDNVTDDRTRAVFDALRNRVRTMALVHEKLYQTADLARLDFADYAGSLLQHLWQANEAAGKVRLNLEIAPVALPVKAAVHCGLILNELASNALKHGFPGGRAGEVTVSLEHDAATNTLNLRVRDNGIGLPAGLDWRHSPSLGLQLVQMLAGGTVETGPGPGTEFRIEFPLKNVQS